jgi:hypothetical protein
VGGPLSFLSQFSVNPAQLVQLWSCQPDPSGLRLPRPTSAQPGAPVPQPARGSPGLTCKGPNNAALIAQLLAKDAGRAGGLRVVAGCLQRRQSEPGHGAVERGRRRHLVGGVGRVRWDQPGQGPQRRSRPRPPIPAFAKLLKGLGYTPAQVANAASTVLGSVTNGNGLYGQMLQASGTSGIDTFLNYLNQFSAAVAILVGVAGLVVTLPAWATALGIGAGVVGALTAIGQLFREIHDDLASAQTLIANYNQAYNNFIAAGEGAHQLLRQPAEQRRCRQWQQEVPAAAAAVPAQGPAAAPQQPAAEHRAERPERAHRRHRRRLEPRSTSSRGRRFPTRCCSRTTARPRRPRCSSPTKLPPGVDPSSLQLTGFGFGQTSVPIS